MGTMLSLGTYFARSPYDIVQLDYGASKRAYIQALEIRNPPRYRNRFVFMYSYFDEMTKERTFVTAEFKTRVEVKSAWDAFFSGRFNHNSLKSDLCTLGANTVEILPTTWVYAP